MARLEINRSGEMEVFARAVELGGFSPAARTLKMTPSAVSKLISRLETRLGARLINRSTRKLTLTPEGQLFHERTLRVLADIDEAESAVAASQAPRGRVRINSSVPFGLHQLLPLVPRFSAAFPKVILDIVLSDTVVDLMDARTDLAIRVGPLRASQLMARKLGESPMVVVASPAYLARHGVPATPRDLAGHNGIGFNFARHTDKWPFVEDGERLSLPVQGDATAGDGETARQLALVGQGLARLSRYHVDRDLATGRLVAVLEDYNPRDLELVHAVYVGHGGQLPTRVRALIDFLAHEVDLEGPQTD